MARRARRVYTAWHPLFVALLEHTLPTGWYQCLSEFQLSREPLRIDVVIVRKQRAGTPPPPRLLGSVLADLADHTLVLLTGPTDELDGPDAAMLLIYALQYLVVAEIDDPAKIALRVVAPRLTPRFVAALAALGCALGPTAVPGIHVGQLGVFPLRVVEAETETDRLGEYLLYTVTPAMLTNPNNLPSFDPEELEIFWALHEHVTQLRHPLPGTMRRHLKDQDKVIESYDRTLARLVARLPLEQRLKNLSVEQRLKDLSPEQRLKDLSPEQRLKDLSPEQRLKGLSVAEAILALPDEALRGLTDDYIVTLPTEVQAKVRERRGD